MEERRDGKIIERDINEEMQTAYIDYAMSEADTTFGKIGVKVWIYKGEILPSKDKGGK